MIAAKPTRLRELILRLVRDPGLPEDTLRWLLFQIDYSAYAEMGRSISGVAYVRTPDGPEPMDFAEMLRGLNEQSELTGETNPRGFNTTRWIASSTTDLDDFDDEESAIIDKSIHRFGHVEPTDISERLSFVGWELAEIGETIPYEIALVGRRGPNDREIEYGRKLQSVAVESLSHDAR